MRMKTRKAPARPLNPPRSHQQWHRLPYTAAVILDLNRVKLCYPSRKMREYDPLSYLNEPPPTFCPVTAGILASLTGSTTSGLTLMSSLLREHIISPNSKQQSFIGSSLKLISCYSEAGPVLSWPGTYPQIVPKEAPSQSNARTIVQYTNNEHYYFGERLR